MYSRYRLVQYHVRHCNIPKCGSVQYKVGQQVNLFIQLIKVANECKFTEHKESLYTKIITLYMDI